MAGTLFSLALSQQLNNQGKPLLDAPLYVYEANTSTPADTFQDFGLGIVNPWPLRTDGAGRLPPFWVDDGAYRARLTDAAGGVVYFDIPYVQALGPSSGGGEGGGGGSVDPAAILQTGDVKWRPQTGTLSGFVRANARTIGSATSGATERANADTQPLYEYLWNNFTNTLCPVSGGRGGSASSDYAANKTIATYSLRGRGQRGLDDMGNSAEGVLVDGTPTVVSTGGLEKRKIARSGLPNVKLSGTTGNGGSHTVEDLVNGLAAWAVLGGSSPNRALTSTKNQNVPNHTHPFETESMNGGVTQTDTNTMDPYMLGTWFIRL